MECRRRITGWSLQKFSERRALPLLYVMDQLSDKKNKEENWVQNLALQDAVARLNERERQIIRMRFYEGQTQMEVAREIGISQAQVSRLEKSALRSMRNYLSDER